MWVLSLLDLNLGDCGRERSDVPTWLMCRWWRWGVGAGGGGGSIDSVSFRNERRVRCCRMQTHAVRNICQRGCYHERKAWVFFLLCCCCCCCWVGLFVCCCGCCCFLGGCLFFIYFYVVVSFFVSFCFLVFVVFVCVCCCCLFIHFFPYCTLRGFSAL